jgi:hypothetical protein
MAKAMAGGQGYRIISLPEQPYQTKYPPLFPALLSLVWMAIPRMPENLGLAALVSWLMLPVFVAAAAAWYRRMGFGSVRTWLFCTLIATNLIVVHFTVYLMPEFLFCALLLAAITLADRATESGSVRLSAAAGLIAAAAYLTKSAALPLVACSPLLFLWRRRPRCAAAFVAAMLPFVAAWTLWCRSHRIAGGDDVTLFYTDYVGYQLYNAGLPDLPHTVWTNLRILPAAVGTLLVFPDSDSPLGFVLPWAGACLAIAGVVRMARRVQVSHYHAFAVGFVSALLVWHFPPNPRFLLPLVALLLAGLCLEFECAARWALRSLRLNFTRQAAAAGVSVLLFMMAAGALLTRYGAPLWFILGEVKERRAEAAAMRETYDWIGRALPAETPFVADLGEVLYLRTGRRAVSMAIPPRFLYGGAAGLRSIDERYRSLAAFARSRGISYVLATRWDYASDPTPERTRAMMPGYLGDRTIFQPVYQRPDAAVYRLDKVPPLPYAR